MFASLDKENKQSLISLVTSLMSMLLNICIGFFISPVVVRDLGVEANGFAQLANNFVSYASLLTIAINAMAGRFTTIAYHRGDREQAQKYYTSALVGNVFVILILILPAILLITNIESLVNIKTTRVTDIKILFALTFMNFFASNIQSTFNICTTVKNKQYLTYCLAMIGNIVRVLILYVLFSYFELHVYYVSLAAGIVSILSILGSYGIKHSIMSDIAFKLKAFNWASMQKILASGMWSVINKCGDLMMTGFDLLLTNILIGSTEMGILSVSKTVPTNLISLVSTLSWNWNPKMTKEYASGDTHQMLDTIDLSAKVSMLLISIPTMIFCVFAPEFYTLWMPTQDSQMLSILSLLSLAPYTLLIGTNSVYNLFVITNNLKFNSVSYCIGAAVSIVLSTLCVKYTSFGLYAVAGISSLVAIIREMFFVLPYAAKILNLKRHYFYKYVLINVGCSILVVAVGLVVKQIIPMNSWITFLIACCVGGLVSILLLSMLIMKKNQRKAMLMQICKRSRRKGSRDHE